MPLQIDNARRLLRPRYSLRTLLVLLTIVSIGSFLWARSREFDRRAEQYYQFSFVPCLLSSPIDAQGRRLTRERLEEWKTRQFEQRKVTDRWNEYCEFMEKKYRRASHCPWLPVATDPQEPERPFYISLLYRSL